ncbi:uncharacterized protein LOC143056179 [Mytilus galloprovincialis]|uniref:uncharacterized protein LOC143056179 n=1 Tax=Mytilus galloprovincialis TaxID=29158 RepID=UPI003F7C30F9
MRMILQTNLFSGLLESENNDDHILVPVIVVLCVIIVFLLVAISVYCIRKFGIVLAGNCWSHDTTESYLLASGEYIPMNKLALYSSNTSTDSIVSDLEYFNHEIRGACNSYKSFG